MKEYYFANYRMLVDDGLAGHESMAYLSVFSEPMSYTHTFTLHLGNNTLLDEKYAYAVKYPAACTTDRFIIRDAGDSWFVTWQLDQNTFKFNEKMVLSCSRDYGEMTIWLSNKPLYSDALDKWITLPVPFTSIIRVACEAGIVMKEGLPLHASLIEKDGYGIVFLGPSGMGKSTQAKLWEKYQGADFIIGDRPVLRCIDGVWYGCGMPWDGKDRAFSQKMVPVKALISLEQAKDNQITGLNTQQAMKVLLNQAMMPMWDDAATASAVTLMGKLAAEIPFYHLRNLANEQATILTRNTVLGT